MTDSYTRDDLRRAWDEGKVAAQQEAEWRASGSGDLVDNPYAGTRQHTHTDFYSFVAAIANFMASHDREGREVVVTVTDPYDAYGYKAAAPDGGALEVSIGHEDAWHSIFRIKNPILRRNLLNMMFVKPGGRSMLASTLSLRNGLYELSGHTV